MKKVLLGFGLCFMLSGCASFFGNLKEPKVDLDNVFAKDTSLTGTTLVFVLDVENPNDKEIKVEEVNYKIFVSGRELTSAKTDKAIVIPAKKTSQVQVPLPIQFTKLIDKMGDVLKTGSLVYRIEGDAKLSFIRIPFSEEGKVQLY